MRTRVRVQGDLSFVALPDLLSWLELSRHSAVLTLEVRNGRRHFYLENGKVVFVSSEKDGERLGQLLSKGGLLEAETVEVSLEESRRFGICFTKYLIEEQMLSPIVLVRVIARLGERILAESVRGLEGTFTCTTPLPRMVVEGPVRLDTGHLILNALRKMDEVETPD